MNQYLKYFIYFLLGVIIYYFLFNSTNAKAQKLIEGFDNDLAEELVQRAKNYILLEITVSKIEIMSRYLVIILD